MAIRQAGGVVVMGDRVVLRRTARGEYLFPKGHVEADETLEETAVREVAEEAGLEAAIVAGLGEASFTFAGEEYRVNYYLMRVTRQLPEWREHEGRDAVAVPLESVRDTLSFGNLREVWDRAARILRPDGAAE